MAKSLDRILQKHTFTMLSKPHCVGAWAEHRAIQGATGVPKLLGNPLDNLKIRKSKVPTWTLTLSAASTSDDVNTCDKSTAQCRKACVMTTAGNAMYPSVVEGRRLRTTFLHEHPDEFLSLLTHEVRALNKRGTPFGLRLNVASDLRWEFIAPWLFDGPNVRPYDYTKWAQGDRHPFDNYRLTYSHSERWDLHMVEQYVGLDLNVAMVFDCDKHELPAKWQGMRVIDGDLSDYRYADPSGVIVGLAAKGSAKTLHVGGFKQAGGA